MSKCFNWSKYDLKDLHFPIIYIYMNTYILLRFKGFKSLNMCAGLPIYRWSVLFLDKYNRPGTMQNLWFGEEYADKYSTPQHGVVMLSLLKSYKTLLEGSLTYRGGKGINLGAQMDESKSTSKRRKRKETNIVIKLPASDNIRMMGWWSLITVYC